MPRQTTDQPITTRAARDRLEARAEPYWRAIDAGIAVGYRKARNGGTWIARALIEGRYRESALGRADDGIRADGETYLDFRQAEAKARASAGRLHQLAAGQDPDRDARTPYTVADALRDYLAAYARRGGKGLAQTKAATDAHILPPLGAVRLDRLNRQRITGWLNTLADEAPRLRSNKMATAPRHRSIDATDADAKRRRRASANRVLTILKAALNYANHEGKITSKSAWESVKAFKEADAPTVRYLTVIEATRLVNACPDDLHSIVVAALLTGMRYGEIASLRVGAFNPETGTLSVVTSKSGHSRHIVLTDEGRAFFADATAGKPTDALVFNRTDGGAWGKSHQHRPIQDACQAARIEPAISFHILRHTYASRLAMSGTPMPVIAAQLGHAGTRMTERHYAHLGPSYVAETVRALFAATGFSRRSNVTPMRTSTAA